MAGSLTCQTFLRRGVVGIYTPGPQRELAALSINSSHDIVTGADHASLASDQRAARRTVSAIEDVVEGVYQR